MMTTRHLVDPELAAAIEQLPVFDFTPVTPPHIRTEQREMAVQAAAALSPTPDIEVFEKFVPGPKDAPDVRVLVYLPKSVARPLARAESARRHTWCSTQLAGSTCIPRSIAT
jgi:hypothetical protein